MNEDLSTSCSRDIPAKSIHYVDNGSSQEYKARLPNDTHMTSENEDNDNDKSEHLSKRNSNERLTLLEVRGGWDCGEYNFIIFNVHL